MSAIQFNGMKVFSATMAQEREILGEKVTAWMAAHPELEIRDIQTVQSSDEAFHCITVNVMFHDPAFSG